MIRQLLFTLSIITKTVEFVSAENVSDLDRNRSCEDLWSKVTRKSSPGYSSVYKPFQNLKPSDITNTSEELELSNSPSHWEPNNRVSATTLEDQYPPNLHGVKLRVITNPESILLRGDLIEYGVTIQTDCQIHNHIMNYSPSTGIMDESGMYMSLKVDEWPPYVSISTDEKGNRLAQGFSIDLLIELSSLLNFRYTLEPEFGLWGVVKSDGNWSGMVGQLQKREKDMIIGALGFQAERTSVMDFSYPFTHVDVTMWVLNPRLRNQIWLALFDMLDTPVICLLVSSICILALLSTAAAKIRQQSVKFEIKLQAKLFELFGAMLGKGARTQPLSFTGKTLIAVWWLFSVIFSITYSCVLVASLSANSTNLPFSTAADMYRQSEYKYGVFGEGTEEMFLKVWAGISEAAKEDPDVLSTDYKIHLERLLNEKYVFLGVELPWRSYVDDVEDAVVQFGDVFFKKDVCLGLQRNSIYTQVMSQGLQILLQFGIVNKLQRKWWPAPNTRPVKLNDVTAIPLDKISGVFFTMGIGLGLASAVFLFEIIFEYVRVYRIDRKAANRSV